MSLSGLNRESVWCWGLPGVPGCPELPVIGVPMWVGVGLARNLLWHLRKVRFRECGDKVGEKFMDWESGE